MSCPFLSYFYYVHQFPLLLIFTYMILGGFTVKKMFKFGCLSIIGLFVLLAILGAMLGTDETTDTATETKTEEVTTDTTTATETEKVVEEEPTEEAVPREYEAALEKAKVYVDMMHMSKQGVYDQLVSEHGDQFPAEAAQYAIDNLQADYKTAALEKAKVYAETMAMSNAGIYDQLISEYGDKFTAEEAQYAVDNM